MLQMGFIEIAYNEDRHLKVTALGKAVLFGRKTAELAVIVREDLRAERRKERRRQKEIIFDIDNAGAQEDVALFEILRTLRKEIALENHSPAYIIMSDKTLHALAADKPTTMAAFGNIFGIGEHKKELYGERFLTVINEYLGREE